MTGRAGGRVLSVALWLAFAAIVAAGGGVLLHACGLSMLSLGWNFCPTTPTALSAESARRVALSKEVHQLKLDLAQKNLTCASIPPPRPPPLELPTHAGKPRPQQTALLKPPPPPPPPPKPPEPAKPPPSVPADRWEKKDLSMIAGCWQIGRDSMEALRYPNGRSEDCSIKAGTICFGDNGSGRREESRVCPSLGSYVCVAPVTGTFASDGTLRTTQPKVQCGAPTSWMGPPMNDLTCRRVSDELIMCRHYYGGEYEFRR